MEAARRPLQTPAMAKLSPCLLIALFATAAHATSSVVSELGSGIGVLSDPDSQCVYTVYVRTGSIWKGGTDSRIGATLVGSDGRGIRIDDLERWGGQMGGGHDYFERGNLDIFSGRGPCMPTPPCRMNLTSDGAGAHHGWYCNYLEVTATGPHMGCGQTLFTVEQWLATDAPPYRLYADVDNCRDRRDQAGEDAGVTAM